MSQIVIKNLNDKTLEVQGIARSLLQNLQDNAIDWMHACGGNGRCTTCRVVVLKGSENMERKTAAELRYEKEGALGQNERLACQVKINGNVWLSVPEACKLPHIKYSS